MEALKQFFSEAEGADWLPPHVKGALIDLMRMSALADGADAERARQLEWSRAMTLDSVHRYFEGRSHDQALEILARAWKDRSPFCLYLRSFKLGARLSGPYAPETVFEDEPLPTVVTRVRRLDAACQRILAETTAPQMPVLRIDNPAAEFGTDGTVAGLSLRAEEWMGIVPALVEAADRIVLLYSGPSPGVDAELEFIQRSGRESGTITILAPEAAETSALGRIRVVKWADDVDESRASIGGALNQLPAQDKARRFHGAPPRPPAPGPTDALRSAADELGVACFQSGRRFTQQHNLTDAAEAFLQAVIMAFWSDNARGRAVSFLELARRQRQDAERQRYALENFKRAADLYAKVVARDKSAAGMLASALQEHAALACAMGDYAAARERLDLATQYRVDAVSDWGEYVLDDPRGSGASGG